MSRTDSDELERKLELRAKELAIPWQRTTFIIGAISIGISIAFGVINKFGVPEKVEKLVAERMAEPALRQAALNAATNAIVAYVAEKLLPLGKDVSTATTNLMRLNEKQVAISGTINLANTNVDILKRDLRQLQVEQISMATRLTNEVSGLYSNFSAAKAELQKFQNETTSIAHDAEVKVEALKRSLQEADAEISRLRKEQRVVTLIARVEALDSSAFEQLTKIANTNGEAAELAKAMLKRVERTLELDKHSSARAMPLWFSGTNNFLGPFTSDEIADFLIQQDESLEGAINWVGEQKAPTLLPLMVDAARQSKDLVIKNRAILAVQNITGKEFKATAWEDFERWWTSEGKSFESWPYKDFHHGIEAMERIDYKTALTNFLSVLRVDPKADQSRALAVVCYAETGELSRANNLHTNYARPNGRWPRLAEIKLTLSSGKTAEATTNLAKFFKEGRSSYGNLKIDEAAYVLRAIDWSKFRELTATESK
jgi:hypothetical protein